LGNATEVNATGITSALPGGLTVPHDGTITGWRIELAGPGGTTETFRFRVIRGTSSVYLGPLTNFTSTGSPTTSRTIAENVAVKQGDKIGLTEAGGGLIAVIYNNSFNGAAVIGNTTQRWNSPLGEIETRDPDQTIADNSVAIQADLSFATCAGLPATITGTEGPEVIIGTPGNDVIAALGGNDFVKAGAGDDVVCGGGGSDKLVGGGGTDKLLGEAGRRDICKGKAGRDRLKKSCETRIQ
jgi:Ca2+-binding RTX toxin-like protein